MLWKEEAPTFLSYNNEMKQKIVHFCFSFVLCNAQKVLNGQGYWSLSSYIVKNYLFIRIEMMIRFFLGEIQVPHKDLWFAYIFYHYLYGCFIGTHCSHI